MSNHGSKLAYLQIVLIGFILLARMYYGLRPADSWGLLLTIVSTIATVILTPANVFEGYDCEVRKKVVNLLNRTRSRQATKQVDRVFALYGVLQKLGAPLQKPDYGKPIGEVYCEFTRAMINWDKSIDILTEASTPALPGTPSWVPDWSTRYHRIYKGHASAAGDSLAKYSFSDYGRKLLTSGVLVDTIEYCTKMLEEPIDEPYGSGNDSIDPAFLSRFLHNMEVLLEWILYARQTTKLSNEAFSDAIFNTVHSETDFETNNKIDLRFSFDEWYNVLTADYSTCRPICTQKIACALALSAKDSVNRYHRGRCRVLANKRVFFVTSRGYIGTGPPSMQVIDQVAILSGLRSPLVLREAGPEYEVIGATYVHGIMHGEAWPEDVSKLLQIMLI
jgi:hypothetical protein